MNAHFQRYTHQAQGMEAKDDGEFVRFDQVRDGIGQQMSVIATLVHHHGGTMQIALDDLNVMCGKQIEFVASTLNGRKAITLHLVEGEEVDRGYSEK